MPELPTGFWTAWAGALGLLVGSFLNVCIFRLPRNCMSVVRPRSRCPKCRTLIAWYDNLPVLSWIALGGKCRRCRAPISPRYAAVELLTGLLFAYSAWKLRALPAFDGAVLFAVHALFIGALVASTFIDLEFRILPDEITLPGLAAGVAFSAGYPPLQGGEAFWPAHPHLGAFALSIVGAAVGGGSIWLVGVLGKLVFRKEAMGFGDVKFMAMVGAVLGWKGVLLTFVLACFLGSVFGIGKFLAVRRMGYVPFGPFLSGGALGMLLWADLVDRAIDAYLRFVRSAVGG
jgi:leader peptidase (prepilin peptidase)/N-methyltransferase